MGVLFQIILTISWLGMFGLVIWLLVLWIKLTKDAKAQGGFFSKILPTFIFTSSVLSDVGKAERLIFVKVFYALVFLIALNLALLLLGGSWLTLEYPENI